MTYFGSFKLLIKKGFATVTEQVALTLREGLSHGRWQEPKYR